MPIPQNVWYWVFILEPIVILLVLLVVIRRLKKDVEESRGDIDIIKKKFFDYLEKIDKR